MPIEDFVVMSLVRTLSRQIVKYVNPVPLLRRMVLPRGVIIHSELNENKGKNEKFYEHFTKCIERAQEEIWILGEGPQKEKDGRLDNEELDYSEMYKGALKRNRNLKVRRIQTTRDMKSLDWRNSLKTLLDRYSDCDDRRFFLYFASTNAAYSAVIDPQSDRYCVTESMLPAESNDIEIAGFGVFVHGRHWLARPMRTKLNRLTESAVSLAVFFAILSTVTSKPSICDQLTTNPRTPNTLDQFALNLACMITVEISTSAELDSYLAVFDGSQPDICEYVHTK